MIVPIQFVCFRRQTDCSQQVYRHLLERSETKSIKPFTWREESIVFYGYASSLYTPQIIFVSNLHGDVTEDVVASPLSLQDSVHFLQPLLRYILAYQCSRFYMPGHLKINLHCHEIQLSWFGHVQRMTDTRTVKKVFNRKPLTKRSQGRPKYRWEDNNKQDICQIKKNWTACVQDREKWKKVVEKAKTFSN